MADDSTTLIGQIRLPVTFVQRDNYRTELIDFDVAHIRLPYNTILGYPALAKFMAVNHHGYNVLKMPGSGGVITVPCEEKDAVCSLEQAFQAASLEDSDRGSRRLCETAPKKKKTSSGPAPQEAGPSGPVPARGNLLPSHRKARPAPSSGRARGLSPGGPPTKLGSRGRRLGTTWRRVSKHVSLKKE